MAETRRFLQPVSFNDRVTITQNGKLYIASTQVTATGAELNSVAAAGGALSPGDRAIKCAVYAMVGATIHAGSGGVVAAWTAPAAAIILRVICDIATVATGACTLDIGYTAVSATTTSDTLLDGIDANGAIATFDSMNAALDSGANALAQKAASAKWITIDEKTGDATGLIGNLYVFYALI